MNTYIRNTGILSMLLVISLFGFGSAFAGSVEGRIQGLQCVVSAKLCPVDSQDPHAAIEKNFVLQLDDNSYYLIRDVSRNHLAPYITGKARISGEPNSEYKSIRADKLEVFVDGRWKTAWSREMEDAQRFFQSHG